MTKKTYRISMLVLLILSAVLSSAVVFVLEVHNNLTPITSNSRRSKPLAGFHIQGAKA
jgi:hypothetical protein